MASLSFVPGDHRRYAAHQLMGLYDHYKPEPPICCPRCNAVLDGWQGKDSQCAMVIWQQGIQSPVGVVGDAGNRSTRFLDSISSFRLPAQFEIYTSCSSCQQNVDVTGFCEHGIWTTVAMGRHRDKNQIHSEMLEDGWRLCSNCSNAWQTESLTASAVCPNCDSLTGPATA